MPSGRRRRVVALAGVVALVAAALIAASIIVDEFVTHPGGPGASNDAGHSAEARARKLAKRNPYARPLSHITPASMLPPASSPLSSSVIWPVVNGWAASDRIRNTAVWAGAAGVGHHSTGRFAILRDNYRLVTQNTYTVDVAGAGPLKITDAPLGPRVVTWAQRRGKLEFTSKSGITGTLHLTDDTVTLNP
jgi:hypothetical protein